MPKCMPCKPLNRTVSINRFESTTRILLRKILGKFIDQQLDKYPEYYQNNPGRKTKTNDSQII